MENSQAEERRIIKIGSDEIDLKKLPTLTIGHKRRLFKETGLDLANITKFNPDDEAKFILFVLQGVRPQTTEKEVDDLPIHYVLDFVLGVLDSAASGREVDHPT